MIRRKIRREEMDNNSNSNNNFFSGFLLGVLVGAAVVFLFGTKKGKKIWEAISEKGVDNISNLLKEADKEIEVADEIEEEQNTPRSTPVRQASSAPLSGASAPKVRRFFRGISRRVN